MSTTSRVPQPTMAELKDAAKQLHFTMNADELALYGEFMSGMISDTNLVDSMDLTPAPSIYPRGPLVRPEGADNPYNAWYWKCQIKGASSGKLHGKRIVIKDNIGIADVPMMNGSDVYAGFVPDEDATVVTRVLDAGGEILGKAVCENYCYSGGSHTSATGPVRNPHNPDYMTGGSSSGCAALLVAGECDMAIGSDQGGSVRMPSSFSGCYGIKPSYGLVPYTGAAPIEQTIDHLGPMANSTADCATLLEVIAGYDDGRDPRQNATLAAKNYASGLERGIKDLRIGIVSEGFGHAGSESDVDEMVMDCAKRLGSVAAKVDQVSIPEHLHGGAIMLISSLDGTLSTFTELGPNGPNPGGHSMLEAIRFYYDAQRDRADLMPVTVKTVLLCARIMRNRYGNYYSAKAQNLRRDLRRAYNQAFANYDLLIMPTTPMKAHKIPPADASLSEILGCALDMIGNTAPFDTTGHPSMSVPAGMSNGLPVGFMLTGRYGEDDVVLRGGHAFEQLSR